ncbi:hypothetical protein UVI_02005700 [Ustilaginoidea virens]|uniref:VLRF1 domain-containing protein n=1 Tax=Ustilaginoidea virens TaxID=1159556 RepID=A0A1B5KV30_USTVR|nr:hypothetical protein UVI_02005700 [Ustilaginoidea virens]
MPVYDLPSKVLDSLTAREDSGTALLGTEEATPSPSGKGLDRHASPVETVVGSLACSLCRQAFASLPDQRSHLKSDFHHYNLKLKTRNQKPVSEQEFEKLVGDLDESLSGSASEDSDDDDDDDDDGNDNNDNDNDNHHGKQDSVLATLLKRQARLADQDKRATPNHGAQKEGSEDAGSERRRRAKPLLIWFHSPLLPEHSCFGMYSALLTDEQQRESDAVEVLRRKQLEPVSPSRPAKDGGIGPLAAYKGPHVFLCMIGGGHFAAMVVSLAPRASKGNTAMNREATVLAHKTFHRYTTRRKQGGSQSANDNAKGAAHSAGSTLRRYNEQALVDEVRALLRDWKGLLDTSELLFIRATGNANRRTLFGPYEGQVLQPKDIRLRGFPFSTRRPTQNELMRSFVELTRLKVREVQPPQVKEAKEEPSKPAPSRSGRPSQAKAQLSEEEETALLHTSQLQGFIRRSKVPALLSYLQNNNLSADFEFQPRDQNHHAPRPLHLAASQNSAPLVLGLLTKGGADPTVENGDGKTAFELAGDRGTRDAFRVGRSELGEARWDWDGARVPAAMTKAESLQRDQREKAEGERREAERRRAEEERLRLEATPPQEVGEKPKGTALLKSMAKSPEQLREEELRGLSPEMRMGLERERRARAAEERLRKMKAGG